MKQVVVLSGKGGTGKTSVVAAFSHLAHLSPYSVRSVLVDADVDAANMGLLLQPQILERHDFTGGAVAFIDQEICLQCGNCLQVCRFDAVIDNGTFTIDEMACEGCAACMYQCPEEAITMQPQAAGEWFHSKSRFGPLFHANLFPAQENSGKLVTLVKQQARLFAMDGSYDLVLVDGPPGIGCPVIASASGADLAILVTEPGMAAVHDVKRVLGTMQHFGIPSLVIINKADIYPQGVKAIETAMAEEGIEVIGAIPFDHAVGEAIQQGEVVSVWKPASPASQALREIWARVYRLLFNGGGDGRTKDPS